MKKKMDERCHGDLASDCQTLRESSDGSRQDDNTNSFVGYTEGKALSIGG